MSLEWNSAPLSRKFYDAIVKIVNSDRNYGVSSIDVAPPEYRDLVGSEPGATEFVVFSLRGNLMKDKIVRGHFRIRNAIGRIANDYDSQNIITLSRKYDYPPTYIIKAVFMHRNMMSSQDIDRLFELEPNLSLLNNYDRTQVELARGCNIDLNAGAEIAHKHELEFVQLFKAIPHKTEVDLIREGSKTTPDLLFNEPILINGEKIHWIDYKDYVGTPNTFLTSKLRKQAEKYIRAHGPGAFAFNGGFVQCTRVNAMLLRAQDCPIGEFSPKNNIDE